MTVFRAAAQGCGVYVVLASLVLTGCALPVPKKTSPQSTGLGIVLEQCYLLGCSSPAVVYFARLDAAGSLTNPKTILKSNYLSGGRVYLLNAPPGIYAVVAIQNARLALSDSPQEAQILERGDAVFLPRQIAEGTVTKISKGEFRYLGAYKVKIESGEVGSGAKPLSDEAAQAAKFPRRGFDHGKRPHRTFLQCKHRSGNTAFRPLLSRRTDGGKAGRLRRSCFFQRGRRGFQGLRMGAGNREPGSPIEHGACGWPIPSIGGDLHGGRAGLCSPWVQNAVSLGRSAPGRSCIP